jgi:hypothetical protein
MFLEKLGKTIFTRISPPFFFGLLLLPFVLVTIILFQKHSEIQELEERFTSAIKKEKGAFERRERKNRFLSRYSNPNAYFIDQNIETFSLLQSEKGKLESMLNHPAFPDSPSLKERLVFLQNNQLSFIEENINTTSNIKEVEEKQRHPVQMDETDLKNLLLLIEDVDSKMESRPQILIQNFHLKKVDTSLQTEVFEVEMDLIKREFTK